MGPTRRTDSAARLRALTRRAYTATAGHLDLEDDAGREFDRIVSGEAQPRTVAAEPRTGTGKTGRGRRDGGAVARPGRRWSVSGRAVVVVLAVMAAFAGAVVARAIALGPSDAVPVPQVSAVVEPAESSPGGPTPPPDGVDSTTVPDEPPGDPGPTEATGVVVVHVAGAVHDPGVVELPVGARVADAVSAAGGEQPDAELAAVNLARPLVDGEQVYVPRVGEAPPGAAEGGGPAGAPPAADGAAADGGVVDLNSADLADLDTLPGVGPAIAQRILEWREANGPFHSVEELLEVSGIGPATLDKLRERVRV
ncbi:competence protein ComEA [Georgenia satyanarayanai]|uniref:Competence protein ComEA n=1 Tax=Georgenia satyanarayanai TaxID=860221 RepID=A0A2Y8ZYP3_9MICO|nr:ComEA family DNA-binding protein [Georgenia satyanarayanai]PYG01598.1 competence protein ComEA [Georgenia satyanarayanai]SSA36398.1 competence protein ComEA [Georgenia satyanarayanai]